MRSSICILVVAAMAVCGTICSVQPALAEEDHELISLEFDNVSVALVAKFFSDLMGENIVVSDTVRDNKITVMMPDKIPVSALHKTFESILDANGLTMVHEGNTMKIVPAQQGGETS